MTDNDEGDETWLTIEENLWSMQLAKVTRLDVLSDKLLFGLWPPFVLAILTFVVSRTVLLVFGLKELTVSWLLEFSLIISGFLLVVVGTFVLSKGYARAVDEIPQEPPEHEIPDSRMGFVDRILNKIDSVVLKISWKGKDDELWKDYSTPPRPRWVLYAGGLTLHLTYLFVLGNYSYVISTQGSISGILDFFIIIPFVYYPLIAEFTAVLANIFLVLPSKIRADRLLTIDDPDGYSGIRPVGRLIKTATLFYILGLIIYTILTIVRVNLFEYGMSSSTVDMIYVIGGSVMGLVIFIYPIFTLNRIIRLQKKTILENIAERVKKTGEDSRFFPATNPDDMETATTYMQEYINMRTIRESRDYPVNIRQVLSVLSALVLPFLINYLSTVLF